MRAWQITKKDLWVLCRDRRTLVILLALPLVFITILGFSTGQLLGWRNENQLLKIVVVDEDHGEMAREVIAALDKRDGLRVFHATAREQGEKLLDDGDYLAAVFIAPDFHDHVEELSIGDILDTTDGKLAAGLESLGMELEYRPSFANTGAIIRDLVFANTLRTLVPHVARKNRIAAQFIDRSRAAREEATAKGEGATPGRHAPAPEAGDGAPSQGSGGSSSLVYRMLVPAYTVMFVFFLVNIMAGSFLHERALGTLRRLRLAPLSPSSLLAGKMAPFFVLSLLQSAVLFLSGRFLYGMSWGTTPWLLVPVIVCTSLAATGLGLLVATIVRTDSQVSAYSNFLVITMAGISGCFMPRVWLPPLMRQVSLATPHAWALTAYDQILNRPHPNPGTVAQCCIALAGFALAFFALGCWRFRRID